MENQIDFLSNNIADELVANSQNQYNSLSLSIPFKYVQKNISLNWNDILFLINCEYLNKLSAIEYAIDTMSISSDDRITYLASSDENDIFDELYLKTIFNLANELTEEIKKETKSKVIFLVLNWLYDNRLNIEDPVHILDIVFDDFEFPLLLQSTINNLHSLDKTYQYKEQVYYIWQELLKELKTLYGV